jgi:hypothetical protein
MSEAKVTVEELTGFYGILLVFGVLGSVVWGFG